LQDQSAAWLQTLGGITEAGINSIVNGLKNATYNGLTQDTIYKILAAFIAGKVTISNTANPNIVTITYFNPSSDSANVLTINVNRFDGSRSTGGSVGNA
jgi:hypothetical protein